MLGLAAAQQRLAVEDALEAAEHQTAGPGRSSRCDEERESLFLRVVRDWETMPFPEQYASLREMLSRITVRDDGMTLSFRA